MVTEKRKKESKKRHGVWSSVISSQTKQSTKRDEKKKKRKKKWKEKEKRKKQKSEKKLRQKRRKVTEREGKGNRESSKNIVSGVLAWNKETEARNPRRSPIALLQLQILIWTTSYACLSVCESKSASENKRREPLKSYWVWESPKTVFIVTVTPGRAIRPLDVGNFPCFPRYLNLFVTLDYFTFLPLLSVRLSEGSSYSLMFFWSKIKFYQKRKTKYIIRGGTWKPQQASKSPKKQLIKWKKQKYKINKNGPNKISRGKTIEEGQWVCLLICIESVSYFLFEKYFYAT